MKKAVIEITQANFIEFCERTQSLTADATIINAVIVQFGSWDNFVRNQRAVFLSWTTWRCKKGLKNTQKVKGWLTVQELSQFYAEFKHQILILAKRRTDQSISQSVIEKIQDLDCLEGAYDLDEIAAGLHDTDSDDYLAISSTMALYCAVEVIYAFTMFQSINKP